MSDPRDGVAIEALPFTGLAGFLIGTSVVAARFGVGQMHPSLFLGLRLSLAAAAYALVFTFRGWPTDRRVWFHAALMAVVIEVTSQLAVLTALQYLSSGVVALVTTLQPALVVVFAHYFLSDEKLTHRKSLGVVLALGGAGLLALRGETGLPEVERANPIGYALLIFSVPLVAGATVYKRKFMQGFDSAHVVGIEIIVAATILMPASALLFGIDLSGVGNQGYVAVLYSAMASPFFGVLLGFYIIKQFGATAAAMVFYIIPVVASIGGVLLLAETFTLTMLVGMVLILVGITIVHRRQAPAVDQKS